MSIRKRLASFIGMMIGFLVIIGGLMELGGPVIVGAFRESLDTMNSLNAIRELKFNIDRQKSSLNRYLLLDEAQELFTFEESSKQASDNLAAIEEQFRFRVPSWYEEIRDEFNESHSAAELMVKDFKAGRKSKAHEKWASELYPKYQKLSLETEELGKTKSQQAQSMFSQIKNLSQKVGLIVLIFFAVALSVGLILFRSLYKAVINPLEALKGGAEKFGHGHFEHRIQLSANNEFGALAESFNQMAQNVNQLQMQAIHMDRMSAVGQLAGGVAHEINNPLTAVLGQTQILLARIKEDDPLYSQLKKIENAAIRCRKIVRGLLDFSRPSQSVYEVIDVNSMVAATLDLCEADLKKSRINVEKKLFLKIPHIRGNMSELQQVLLNLVNNAIQAMPQGGTLTLATRSHNERMTFPARQKGGAQQVIGGPWVELRVADTGVGISREHLNRIFDPFFTTKDIGKGTGLGLSVSTGIVQKHRGDLTVESKGKNQGSSFIMTLSTKGPAESVQNPKKNRGMAA